MGTTALHQPIRSCGCHKRLHLLASPLILLWTILPASSFAQLTSATSEATSSLNSAESASSASPTSFITSISTSLVSSTSDPTTRSDASPTGDVPSPTFFKAPPAAHSDMPDGNTRTDHNTSLLNYYFVFLAIFGILLFIGAYFLHRRKKRVKARFRSSGQNALARDLDGWVNTRRWMHGNWRTGINSVPARREEGLNELGEAPPPYKATPDAPPPADDPRWAEEGNSSRSGLPVPLNTLSREGRATLKPPGYAETIRSGSASSIARGDEHVSRPAAVATRPNTGSTSRPNTASLSTAESTGQLLRRPNGKVNV